MEIGFGTKPTNLMLKINGEALRYPATLLSWEGYGLNVSAPRQREDGRTFAFWSWSDGGPREHLVATPHSPATYTATFRRVRR